MGPCTDGNFIQFSRSHCFFKLRCSSEIDSPTVGWKRGRTHSCENPEKCLAWLFNYENIHPKNHLRLSKSKNWKSSFGVPFFSSQDPSLYPVSRPLYSDWNAITMVLAQILRCLWQIGTLEVQRCPCFLLVKFNKQVCMHVDSSTTEIEEQKSQKKTPFQYWAKNNLCRLWVVTILSQHL